MSTYEEEMQRFKTWRGIRTCCQRCNGSGVIQYSSTAGWRNGIGGQAITDDVCDTCWGSGCTERLGVNLRELLAAHDKALARVSLVDWVERAGVQYSFFAEAVPAIISCLHKFGNKRSISAAERKLARSLELAIVAARIRATEEPGVG